jgi:hypothetical protein
MFFWNSKCLNGKETKLDFVLIWCDLINMPHERRIRFQNVKDEKKKISKNITRNLRRNEIIFRSFLCLWIMWFVTVKILKNASAILKRMLKTIFMKSTSIKCQLNELTEHRINENLRQNSFEQADSNLKTIFCLIKNICNTRVQKF